MSYTLFETIRVRQDGNAYEHLNYHLDRLRISIKGLGYKECLVSEVPSLLHQMLPFSCERRVKVCVSKDQWWVEVSNINEAENVDWQQGIQVFDTVFERPDPALKYETSIYREMILKAREQECHETIFIDHKGYVREGNISNVFFVKNNIWITPKDDVLQGVQRRILIDQLQSQGILVELRAISKEEAQNSDHIFITNRIKGVVPVIAWGTKKYPIMDVNKVLNGKG